MVTSQPITWSRVFPEKLRVVRLVKKYTTFYGTRRLITVFTRARHCPLPWAIWIQSSPPLIRPNSCDRF